MPGEESLYPEDWLRIAEKDLDRAIAVFVKVGEKFGVVELHNPFQ